MQGRAWRRSVVVAVVFAGSGCVAWQERAHEVTTPRQTTLAANDVDALIEYAGRARSLAPPVLAREYARVQQGYTSAPNPAERVKLAVLLSLRHTPFRDEPRARSLLLQATADPGYNAGDYRALAALLLETLDERREIERSFEDERRQKVELSRQLQQLKTIEEEIDRRSGPVGPPPQHGTPRPDTDS